MSAGDSPDVAHSSAASDLHLGQAGDVVAVEARHRPLVGTRTLGGGSHDGGRVGQVPCPLGARDDEGLGAVALLAAVEQAQRLDDEPARLVVRERDRLLVEPRRGIGRRVAAVGDGDAYRSPRSVAPERCMYRWAHIATQLAGVSSPNGDEYEKLLCSAVPTTA